MRLTIIAALLLLSAINSQHLPPSLPAGRPLLVRRWQPSSVTIPKPSPSTSTTTQSTTTTSTATPETTTEGEETTTDWCHQYSPARLERMMRDEGIYDSAYMAPDIERAGDDFPDLANNIFMRNAERYTCDSECQQETASIRNTFREKGHSVQTNEETAAILAKERQSVTPPVTTPPPWCTWAQIRPNPAFWSPTKPQNNHKPTPSPRRRVTLPWWSQPRGSNYNPWPQWRYEPKPQPLYRQRIKRQDVISSQQEEPHDFIGKTFTLECTGAGTEDTNGMQRLCGSCRAVRQLPADYFPRILNEVICTNEHCFKGFGRCKQKFLPFKVLRNVGTLWCEKWVSVEVAVRTCCDCQLSTDSGIHQYLSLQ